MVYSNYGYDYSFNRKSIVKNRGIIKNFVILRDYTSKLGQFYKSKAYQRAIDNIKNLDFEINKENVEYLLKNNLVGKKLYEKIIEYLNTGKMKAMVQVNKEYQAKKLLDIKGFGNKKVEELITKGIFSIDTLKKHINSIELSRLQKIGIKYYKDLSQKIPREEIEEIYKILYPILKNYKHELVGSYRRGKKYSGDIDIVVSCENSCEEISNKISRIPNYITYLSIGKTKFSFLIRHNNVVRQVDLLIVPRKSYYTALVHFTGSSIFNERIRSIAKKKDMKVNEYFILKNNKKFYPKSEKEYFDFLDIKYMKPEERNF